tara:strand:- start:2888 stop:4669 length:1782 start_codon:yes stop_codon:yes gene_type:complete
VSALELITEHLDLWTGAVKKKSSSGRGSNGKVELTGVKMLRALILELAVRGKLVEQYPVDTSAEQLLEHIAELRKELIASKTIKNSNPLPTVTPDEAPSELPAGWAWTRLGSIAEINPRNMGDDTLEASFIPMPLVTTSYHGEHGDEPRNWGEIKKGYSHFANGDIGLAKITPCFENSKAAVFRNLRNGIGAGTTELHVARPLSSVINPYFLLLFLKSPRFLTEGEKVMTGSAGQKRVPKDYFAETPLPLPPEEEQHRIIHKVHELMTLCDRLEQQTSDQLEAHETLVDALLGTLTKSENATELADNWARLAAYFDILFTTEQSIDKLKQTILQVAMMGRLVEQNSDDEPAKSLLAGLSTIKKRMIAKGVLKKERRLHRVKSNNAPYELPPNWTWCSLTDIGELARGKSKHRPRNDPALYRSGTVPLVQTGDVARASPKVTTFSTNYNEKGVEQSRLWKAGTLCITIAANIGDTGILDFDACFPDSVVGFTPFDDRLGNEYFAYFMRTAKQHLEEFAPATAQKNINLDVLQNLLVPLPPAAEIGRIVQKINELMGLCEQLKERLNQARETRCHFAEATLVAAVHGSRKRAPFT